VVEDGFLGGGLVGIRSATAGAAVHLGDLLVALELGPPRGEGGAVAGELVSGEVCQPAHLVLVEDHGEGGLGLSQGFALGACFPGQKRAFTLARGGIGVLDEKRHRRDFRTNAEIR